LRTGSSPRSCPKPSSAEAGRAMTLDRLDHLVLTVRDADATCEFYRRALGMEVVTFGQGRLALRFGAQKLNLHPAGREPELKAARPTPGSGDLCFLTGEPLDAWVRRLGELRVPVLEGPVARVGALGPIESIYLRDPDGNLLEIARQLATSADPLAPIRAWLSRWEACVRAADFEGGRRLCAPDLVAFGTVAYVVEGIVRVMEEHRHYGVCIFPTDYSIRIDELARAAEERGFESLFVTEHTHIPASRRTPFPGGTELPREYSHTLDPFVALTAAAAVTRTLKVGTGICLVIEHDPITLAKQVASLDFLSGGRFLFGIGGGWNAEEMENHGTAFKTRF